MHFVTMARHALSERFKGTRSDPRMVSGTLAYGHCARDRLRAAARTHIHGRAPPHWDATRARACSAFIEASMPACPRVRWPRGSCFSARTDCTCCSRASRHAGAPARSRPDRRDPPAWAGAGCGARIKSPARLTSVTLLQVRSALRLPYLGPSSPSHIEKQRVGCARSRPINVACATGDLSIFVRGKHDDDQGKSRERSRYPCPPAGESGPTLPGDRTQIGRRAAEGCKRSARIPTRTTPRAASIGKSTGNESASARIGSRASPQDASPR